MPTISEIADYLRQREVEDPIALKSQERVLTQMAESVKENTALAGGQCHLCSRQTEALVPIVMRVCKACITTIMRYGAGVTVLQTHKGWHYCDKCLAKAFDTISINPRICQYCSQSLGRFHKYNITATQKVMMKDLEKRQRKNHA